MDKQQHAYIYEQIVSFMEEGVALLSMSGRFQIVNETFRRILGIEDELQDKAFAGVFLEDERNNDFVECVVDCVYQKSTLKNHIVRYYAGQTPRTVMLTTSFLMREEEKLGVILVVGDLTELSELQDAVKAMDAIQKMNVQLENRNRLISQTFGRYLSDEIVRQLLDTPDGAALGGKKQYISILMSDLRGFTAMSERMEPVCFMRMLNHYLGEMTEIIERHRGTIIEFIGDAIFAVFGAPVEREGHETAAVRCAIEMQNRMAAVNAFNAQEGYETLEMGIGINSGEVILGNIGSERRAKYGVVGRNVNLAGRVESYTVGGQVLVSEYTAAKVEGLRTKGEQKILPKGVKSEISIFDVAEAGGVALVTDEETLRPLKTPLTLEYQLLDGKYAQKERHSLTVLALSPHQAEVDTDFPKSTNLKLLYGEQEIFAKATDKGRLHFTGGADALKDIINNK